MYTLHVMENNWVATFEDARNLAACICLVENASDTFRVDLPDGTSLDDTAALEWLVKEWHIVECVSYQGDDEIIEYVPYCGEK